MNIPFLRHAIILIGILLLTTNLIGQDMKQHKWQNRVLVIQTTEDSSKLYLNQLKEFANSKEALQERKLVVYRLVNNKYQKLKFSSNSKAKITWQTIETSSDFMLNKIDSFKVTLIGLDGGIKLEQTTLLKKEELFRIIDSMPMRLNELRNQRRKLKDKG